MNGKQSTPGILFSWPLADGTRHRPWMERALNQRWAKTARALEESGRSTYWTQRRVGAVHETGLEGIFDLTIQSQIFPFALLRYTCSLTQDTRFLFPQASALLPSIRGAPPMAREINLGKRNVIFLLLARNFPCTLVAYILSYTTMFLWSARTNVQWLLIH